MWEAQRPQGNALLCAAHGPQFYNPNPHMERAVPVTAGFEFAAGRRTPTHSGGE